MKKVAMLLVAVLMSTLTYAQKMEERNIPQAVKTAFQKAFPDAKEVKWEKENSFFEANFEVNETDYSVIFDANGNIMETEVEIEPHQLPQNIAHYLAQHYKGQKIKEAAKITDAKGVVTYEAEIKDKDLIFDEKGNFIKEIKK
ncbi:PepSY-like domain-containing protein [Rhodoflexus caldus]|uniref:PepSY-like domain-containing protein n=1 Tax=Rhodoflexus caldus TaxID=2891236 RepID=UPI002029C621|nr:PepSY-like domain-containing protein [Rhodoflexus caldus]